MSARMDENLRGQVFAAPAAGPAEVADRAAAFGVATIAAVLGADGPGGGLVGAELLPRRSGTGAVAGFATTSWSPAGHNTMTWFAIDAARSGDVLILASDDDTVAQWGEIATTASLAKGIAAVVVAGATRDVGACRAAGASVWARAVNPAEAAKGEPGYVNGPVDVLGATVHAGDLVVADDDGMVVVPRNRCDEVLAAAQSRTDQETVLRADVSGGVVIGHLERKLSHLGVRRVEGTAP